MLHEHDLLVIGKVIHSTFPYDYSPLALPFRSDIADIVVSMSNNLIDLYKEIEKNVRFPCGKNDFITYGTDRF